MAGVNRERQGEERTLGVFFVCFKEGFSGLSMSSLVLSCTADTPSRVTCFNFQTVRFIYHLLGEPLKLGKNYSCQ